MPARSPLALAALACAAIRGLEPLTSRDHAAVGRDDLDVALVADDRCEWVVRAPRNAAAGARLEAEGKLLTALGDRLPYAVPQVEGSARLPEGGRAVVHRTLRGSPVDLAALTPAAPLVPALGRALAALHDVPEELVEDVGLPVYSADEYRRRRLAEVDRAAGSGHVPASLLGRWEHALEEVGAWRFVPCVVHGDLAPENVLVERVEVTGILEWSETRIADPADDFAWLASGCTPPTLRAIVDVYAGARRTAPDQDLTRRARLAAELAVARWLLHGVSTGDTTIVDDAVAMLTDLDAAVTGSAW
ncbi:MAG: macrolide phosphotransferase [Actinomycetota bacterium]|nr:macrolide phosphotransferase [Actinomycetota bacterium]